MKKILKYIKENWEKILVIAMSAIALIIMYLFPILGEIKTLKENQNNINKRALRYNQNEFTYINLLTDSVIDSDVHAYYNANGSLVNSSALTLTNRFVVNPSVSYVYGNATGQVCYVTFFDVNGNFISSTTKVGLITSPSNANYCALSVFNSRLNDSYFYQGQIVYNYYLPPLENLTNEYYENGYQSGLDYMRSALFTLNNVESNLTLFVFDDNGWYDLSGLNDDFNASNFFKGFYVDLAYLRAFQYSRYLIAFNETDYTLNDLALALSNENTNDYNIIVNNTAYLINSTKLLTIKSVDPIETIIFNSDLLDNQALINNSIDYALGFNKGYNQGFSDGETETNNYYNDTIIPGVKTEYEEIGYNSGYYNGYNQGLVDGSEDFGVLGFLRSIFGVVADVLTIEILPKIKLIYIISIPLVLSVVKFVLGLFR